MNATEVLRASIEDAHTTFIGTTWDMTYVVKNQRALAALEALVRAAVVRLDTDHDPDCNVTLSEGSCDCGHDALAAAVARVKGGSDG